MLTAIKKYKEVLSYGLSLAVLFFLLRFIQIRFLIFSHQYEIYIGLIALIFTALGIWLANKITTPKIQTVYIERQINQTGAFVLNESALQNLNISKRELEVLSLMATGKSNQEIASELFISLSTVKTHVKNLFDKLDAKRRTQAVENAKKQQILP